MTDSLSRLWALTNEELADGASDWNTFFDPIGMILDGTLRREEYFCTPKNSVTFARTGGDGVHYGLLDVGEGYNDKCPVVMTVPMSDTHNTVVGENLIHFLALGCRQGFLSLDGLIHRRARTISTLDSHADNEYADTQEMLLFEALTNEFNLSPWEDHAARLDELAMTYFGLVDAKSFPD